ncbi:MAG: chemotaxis protein CheB, partial [Verrucomicrobiota bacterium]
MTSKKGNITESLNESLVLKVLSPENANLNNFPIVGIGASAGGLEALEQFFENMPGDCGMAFVVIQHLDPNYIGVLPELLQRFTTMKVLQATDKLKIKPNHIYVIPPNKDISILNGELYLFAPTEARGLRLPIDTFFRSLAAEKDEKSIGIVLSGMGSDGSLGVKSIKEKNGIVLVQDPVTAKFNAMPTHACEAVSVDIIALASELPAKLIAFLDSNHHKNYNAEPEGKIIRYLNKILILIREQSGHDFSMYKKNNLIRQIDKRKGIHQIEKIGNYVRYLQENPNEVEILYKEMLIGVSSFFRDSALWEMLREKTIPDLIESSAGGTVLRAWVTACSTGEEAYSLAIIFKEAIEQKKMVNITLQIFATDIDSDAIDYARKGVFSKKISSEISPERMSKFFISETKGFRVNSAIREMIIFATQNVIKDPPFTKIDILTCRNLLIYMEPELQNKMMSLFHYSLNLSGIMILGSAENPRGLSTGFAEINSKLKIYKRSSDTSTTALIDFPSSFHHKKEVASGNKIPPKKIDNIQIITDQFLLQHFTPPSVLVNTSGDILNITGRTGKYLEPASGKANWNIFAMARKGIIEELPGALRKVQLSFDPIIIPNLKVGTNGGTQYLNMPVQRLEISNSTEDLILIVFIAVPSPIEKLSEIPKNGKQRSISHQIELENQLQQRNELIQ